MNVIFISPHFPSHFYQFCKRLKDRGVNVLGIGDAPYEALTENCRNALTEYRSLPSLMEAAHGDDIISYCQAVPEDLQAAGERLLAVYQVKNRFFHFEFFRLDADREGLGNKGDIVGLEVNMRALGGRITDKMHYHLPEFLLD